MSAFTSLLTICPYYDMAASDELGADDVNPNWAGRGTQIHSSTKFYLLIQ